MAAAQHLISARAWILAAKKCHGLEDLQTTCSQTVPAAHQVGDQCGAPATFAVTTWQYAKISLGGVVKGSLGQLSKKELRVNSCDETFTGFSAATRACFNRQILFKVVTCWVLFFHTRRIYLGIVGTRQLCEFCKLISIPDTSVRSVRNVHPSPGIRVYPCRDTRLRIRVLLQPSYRYPTLL